VFMVGKKNSKLSCIGQGPAMWPYFNIVNA